MKKRIPTISVPLKKVGTISVPSKKVDTISVHLDSRLMAVVTAAANLRGLSRSEYVYELIRQDSEDWERTWKAMAEVFDELANDEN